MNHQGDNRFLRELRRWARPATGQRPGSAWAAWASALRGAWGRRPHGFPTAWTVVLRLGAPAPAPAVPPRPGRPGPVFTPVTLRLTIGPFHVALQQQTPPPDGRRPPMVPRAAVVQPAPAFVPVVVRPPLVVQVPAGTPAFVPPAGGQPAAVAAGEAPRRGPVRTPPANWAPALMWHVVRDRLVAAAPSLTPRPTASVAVAAAAALRLRRLLVEQHTRRELLTLAAAAPVYQRPAAPEPAATRPQAFRAPEGAWPAEEFEAVRRPGAAAAAAAPLDVERLTDQVVRRIDERILAYRERMGKVF